MPHVTISELLARNHQFAVAPNHIPRPYTREQTQDSAHTIVISCFDPRAVPEEFFCIETRGREIVSIRNAGGHTQHIVHDILSLDNLLETRDIIVVHHTDCGLTHTTNERIREQLKGYVGESDKKVFDYEAFEFGCMTAETLPISVNEDVEFLKNHPWIRKEVVIKGFMYDIKSGLLHEV
jgi:carbonic anhydrase